MKKHQGDPPTCVGCAHFSSSFERCRSDDCATFNPVEGRQVVKCSDARAAGGACGPNAKFFEPPPPPGWLRRNALPMFLYTGFGAWLIWSGTGWELFKFGHWIAGYGHLP